MSSLPPPEAPRLGAAAGQLLGWAILGVFNAITIAFFVPFDLSLIRQRVAHHVYDAGHILVIGLASAGAVAVWIRLRPRLRPRPAALLDLAAVAVVALVVGFLVLGDDLGNLAGRIVAVAAAGSRLGALVRPALIVAVALGVPLAAGLGRLLDRPRLRWIAVLAALSAGAANELILQSDYPGAHLYLAWAAVALGSAATAGLPLPASLLERRARDWRIAIHALFASVAAYTLVVWPGGRVMLELAKVSGAVLAPYLAKAHHGNEHYDERLVPPAMKAWFAERPGAPEIAPTAPSPADKSRIVLLLFIDSFRADILASPANAKTLPEVFALKRRGVYFPAARSPGAGTVYSVTQIFTSRYLSQLYWAPKVPGGYAGPNADPSTRFPTLLAQAGVATVTYSSIDWMINEDGVVRGFTEEEVMPAGKARSTPQGSELVDATIARLERHGEGPLFLFLHFMDAHFPYNCDGPQGSNHERYMRGLHLVDVQLGRLRAAIARRGFTDRTTTIISADHGEAFGEHGTTHHGTTLYDELVRVPLIIAQPGAPPRVVAEPVSLIDLGPTILDLMGVPTPGSYMGQSLVPFLHGQYPLLTRPIAAEGRLIQSLYFVDGLKAIYDQRKGADEVYDLIHDPSESNNLFEEGNVAMESRLNTLATFFQAHQLERRGSSDPVRP